MKQIYFFLILLFCCSMSFGQWRKLNSGSDATFRALDVVNKNVIWAGGSAGTILKSTNGGRNWQVFQPGSTKLDFRGIYAFNEKTVLAMSAGLAEEGSAVVFKTTDGGKTWKTVFKTDEAGVFLDGIEFVNRKHGFIIGDPIDQKAYVLETFDGGEHWARMYVKRFPKLNANEASFAASNSGIVSVGNKVWYAFQRRILVSEDEGESWKLIDTKFPSHKTSGIFGLFFWNRNDGILMGGDYKNERADGDNLAVTSDRGTSWAIKKIEGQGLKESATKARRFLVVVGPSGTSISSNLGKTWHRSDGEAFHAVASAGKWVYAVGGKGNIAKAKVKRLLPSSY